MNIWQQIQGDTDVSLTIYLHDLTTNGPAAGLTITDLDFTYCRPGEAAVKVDLTALGAVTGAHEDNKAIEIDSTNLPGTYRLDIPDAVSATGARIASIGINDAAGRRIGWGILQLATAMRGTDGANTTVPDAAGTAAALHAITDGLIGALARTGADSDTLETLSDQLDTLTSGVVLSTAGLQDFLDVDTTYTFSDAVAGSIVKELADHAMDDLDIQQDSYTIE